MKEFTVHSEDLSPRFRNGAGKTWHDGDIITEEDLLTIYRPDHIEMLIESGALVPVGGSARKPKKTASK